MSLPDGQLKLTHVPAQFVDRAWAEGAHALSEACEASGGEITGEQLKLILSRGERILLRMDEGEQVVGWGVVRVDQLPNLRVLHACEMTARGVHFERFFEALKGLASSLGCSRIRCSAKPVQARLYRMKCGFEPVYETLEAKL